MPMKVFVDSDGLAAAGATLSGGGPPNTPPPAEPGAADPVSQSLFAILGTRGLLDARTNYCNRGLQVQR
jgi:hypothetical protein